MVQIENVNPCDWYKNLTKKEKSKFLDFMFNKYQMRPTTLARKLSSDNRYRLTAIELNVINATIQKGEWHEEN